MKKFIRWLISKLDDGSIYVLPQDVVKILAVIQHKITVADYRTDISAEAKRSIVYGSTVKKYPKVKRRDVAMAIEIAIQRSK